MKGLDAAVLVDRHKMSPLVAAAPIAAFAAIPLRQGDRACTAKRSDSGRSKAKDGERRLFCFAMQSRPRPGGLMRLVAWGGSAGGGKQLLKAVADPGDLPP